MVNNHPERGCGNCANCGNACTTCCNNGDNWIFKSSKPHYRGKDLSDEYDRLKKLYDEYGYEMVIQVAVREIINLRRKNKQKEAVK